MYDKVSGVIKLERKRNRNYNKWQVENLPDFNKDVLVRFSAWYMYDEVIAWKFVGIVNRKVWQPFKGYDGFYEPNKRSNAGKAMNTLIKLARGNPYNRLDFYDLLGITMPIDRARFKIPNGFLCKGIVYMIFDDSSHNEITTKLAGQFEEITYGEWQEAIEEHNKS